MTALVAALGARDPFSIHSDGDSASHPFPSATLGAGFGTSATGVLTAGSKDVKPSLADVTAALRVSYAAAGGGVLPQKRFIDLARNFEGTVLPLFREELALLGGDLGFGTGVGMDVYVRAWPEPPSTLATDAFVKPASPVEQVAMAAMLGFRGFAVKASTFAEALCCPPASAAELGGMGLAPATSSLFDASAGARTGPIAATAGKADNFMALHFLAMVVRAALQALVRAMMPFDEAPPRLSADVHGVFLMLATTLAPASSPAGQFPRVLLESLGNQVRTAVNVVAHSGLGVDLAACARNVMLDWRTLWEPLYGTAPSGHAAAGAGGKKASAVDAGRIPAFKVVDDTASSIADLLLPFYKPAATFRSSPLCFRHQIGTCQGGSSCTFLHVTPAGAALAVGVAAKVASARKAGRLKVVACEAHNGPTHEHDAAAAAVTGAVMAAPARGKS